MLDALTRDVADLQRTQHPRDLLVNIPGQPPCIGGGGGVRRLSSAISAALASCCSGTAGIIRGAAARQVVRPLHRGLEIDLERRQTARQTLDLGASGFQAQDDLLREDAELGIRSDDAAGGDFDADGEGPHIGQALAHIPDPVGQGGALLQQPADGRAPLVLLRRQPIESLAASPSCRAVAAMASGASAPVSLSSCATRAAMPSMASDNTSPAARKRASMTPRADSRRWIRSRIALYRTAARRISWASWCRGTTLSTQPRAIASFGTAEDDRGRLVLRQGDGAGGLHLGESARRHRPMPVMMTPTALEPSERAAERNRTSTEGRWRETSGPP